MVVYSQLYHNQMSTNPTKQAIFTFLGQIGFDRFPEFILDILTKVEHHTMVDITDGPGDEKQDILTISPEGKRCLTQCKHTSNPSDHYNGDDLDTLVAACMRKDCRMAFFATNSDFTPQGKKFVNDKEYLRGWPDKDDPIVIEYWNDIKIWDKIKANADILNKWFGGLGQTHGLRNFKFDVTVQQLPYEKGKQPSNNFEEILSLLLEKSLIKEIIPGIEYEALMNNGIKIFIKKWFQFTGRLDIKYVMPGDKADFINQFLYALSIEVSIPATIPKYAPTQIRESVVRYLFEGILTEIDGNKWWHITSGQSRSFVFLHEIGEPRQITLDSAQTFVKVNHHEVVQELLYCKLQDTEFELIPNDEDDTVIWRHKTTGIDVIQIFEEKLNPAEVYEHQIIQLHNINEYAAYTFKAIRGIDKLMMMRVRRILNLEWLALQQNNDTLIWGYPPDTKKSELNKIEKQLTVLGLKVLGVTDEDRDYILSNVQKDMPPPSFIYQSETNKLTFPVSLNERVFWLQKNLMLSKELDEYGAIELLKYKYTFENLNGFENMGGKETMHTHTSELPNLLLDMFTFRGRRMLDIGINDNPITVMIRFREGSIESSNDSTLKCVEEFTGIYNEITNLLAKYI